MTDSADTTKEEPKKAGKSFFFDFINQKLADAKKEYDTAQQLLDEKLAKAGDERRTIEKRLDKAKDDRRTLLGERRQAIEQGRRNRRAARQISRIEAKIKRAESIANRKMKLLNIQKNISGFGATLDAIFSFNSDKNFATRLDEAQQKVKDEFSRKIEDVKTDFDGKKNNLTNEKSVIEARKKEVKQVTLKEVRDAFKTVRKVKADLADHNESTYNTVQELATLRRKHNRKNTALNALGVVTSPAKLAVDGVNRVRESEGYKRAKRVARVVSARKALHFKQSCKNLWVGGKKMFSDVGKWIKESPGKAVGLAKSLAESAKSGLKAMKIEAVARRETRKAWREHQKQERKEFCDAFYNAAKQRLQGQGQGM